MLVRVILLGVRNILEIGRSLEGRVYSRIRGFSADSEGVFSRQWDCEFAFDGHPSTM
jgi:hypothetical protein